MSAERIAMEAAGLAIELIRRKLRSGADREAAAHMASTILREKLTLRRAAQSALDARKRRQR